MDEICPSQNFPVKIFILLSTMLFKPQKELHWNINAVCEIIHLKFALLFLTYGWYKFLPDDRRNSLGN